MYGDKKLIFFRKFFLNEKFCVNDYLTTAVRPLFATDFTFVMGVPVHSKGSLRERRILKGELKLKGHSPAKITIGMS